MIDSSTVCSAEQNQQHDITNDTQTMAYTKVWRDKHGKVIGSDQRINCS